MSIGISRDNRPPWGLLGCPRRTCLYTRLTPSTITFNPPSTISSTLRGVFPASSPINTCTMSPLLIFMVLNYLTCEADDFHELAIAQFAGHRSENTRALGILLVIDEHDRVTVETNVTSVGTTRGFPHPHDHAPHHVAGLHRPPGDRLLDTDNHHIAQAGVTAPRAPQH